MQFKALALTFFATVTVAQSSNDTSATLPELLGELPECVIPCFDSSARSVGCSTTDFACLCLPDKMQSFASQIVTCSLGKCSIDQLTEAANTAGQICNIATSNPNSTEVASASAIISSALATGTPDAAFRADVNFGLLGAAIAVMAAL